MAILGGDPPRQFGDCILVVDDDASTRALYSRALRRAGFGILEAADGATALATVHTESVSLVLLDNQMPGMSGREVLRSLRSSEGTRTLPVILVTGETARSNGLALSCR